MIIVKEPPMPRLRGAILIHPQWGAVSSWSDVPFGAACEDRLKRHMLSYSAWERSGGYLDPLWLQSGNGGPAQQYDRVMVKTSAPASYPPGIAAVPEREPAHAHTRNAIDRLITTGELRDQHLALLYAVWVDGRPLADCSGLARPATLKRLWAEATLKLWVELFP